MSKGNRTKGPPSSPPPANFPPTPMNTPTTQAAHTPGPWTATETGILGPTLNDHGNFYICALPFPSEEPSAQEAANLRLIAAAPELLAIVRALVAGGGIMEPAELFDRARAAIAKAEGAE